MNVKKVTITGADDSVTALDMKDITERFPYVEWGILLSRSQEGSPRFPSKDWLDQLADMTQVGAQLVLSGHLCGAWVRDIIDGGDLFVKDRASITYLFKRYQLNFHAFAHWTDPASLSAGLSKFQREPQFIFQFDEVNNPLLQYALQEGYNAVPLFDTSGGAGVLPTEWPAFIGTYCGYAGGLSPDNLEEQMEKILEVAAGQDIWIDVETHVRSHDNAILDLEKVYRFLEISEQWVG